MHKLIFEYSMKLRTCIYIIVLLGVIESFCGESLFAKRKKDKIEEAKPSAEEIILKKKGVPNGLKDDDLFMLAMTFLFY